MLQPEYGFCQQNGWESGQVLVCKKGYRVNTDKGNKSLSLVTFPIHAVNYADYREIMLELFKNSKYPIYFCYKLRSFELLIRYAKTLHLGCLKGSDKYSSVEKQCK